MAAAWATAAAARASPPTLQDQIDQLRDEIAAAESANAVVRDELDQAQLEVQNEWLSAERAEQIGVLVNDVLADAEMRGSLTGDGVMMGWSEGFFLASADGRYGLTINGLMQTRFIGNWVDSPVDDPNAVPDEWRYGFEVTRTRLDFGGHIGRRGLQFLVQTGYGRLDPDSLTNDSHTMAGRVWDAWIRTRLSDSVAVTMGIFKLPFTRESLVAASAQLAIEKTTIDHRLGLGRSQGVELTWASPDRRVFVAFSSGSTSLFHNAIFGQPSPVPPWAALESDVEYAVTMRHEWKLGGSWDQFNQFTAPLGTTPGVLIGLAGHMQHTERDNGLPPPAGLPKGRYMAATIDATLQFDGASAYVGIIAQRVRDFSVQVPEVNWFGMVLQASTYVTNRDEVFLRWEAGGSDAAEFNGKDLSIMTAGVNHYLDGQDLKFSADIGFSFGDVDQVFVMPQAGTQPDTHHGGQLIFRTQFQLAF